jgi:uncharacterized protein (TIGR03083 family)
MEYTQSVDRLSPEITHFADVVSRADLSAPVPTGDAGWTMETLVRHVGNIHRWAEQVVRTLSPTRIGREQCAWEEPEDPAALSRWLREGAAPLVATLRAAQPDAPVWSWGADHHVRFWARRQIHETTVHRVDAEMALGLPPAIDSVLAADGVSEFLENAPCAAYFAPGVAELKGSGQVLGLRATDVPAQWAITLHEAGFSWAPEPARAPTAHVEGSAADLYLLLWNRRATSDERLRVKGDEAFAAWFVEKCEM